MLARRTLSLLSAFQPSDWKLFLRWMNSPLHNTDEGLARLAPYFRTLAPAVAPEHATGKPAVFPPATLRKLSPAAVWSVLYPEKTEVKEGVLRVKIRQFTSQIEAFLVWRELDKDAHLQRRLLLNARGPTLVYDQFEQATLKEIKRVEEETERGVNYFYQKMQLQADLINHPGFDDYRGDGRYLRQLDACLDAFFALFKYRLASELKNRERIRGEKYEMVFWDQLREKDSVELLEGNVVDELYQQLFSMQEQPDIEPLWDQLKIDFERRYQQLPTRDLRNIYFSTLNYLSRKINEGKSRFYPETLAWYGLGLEAGILLDHGLISHVTFNNIALLGYRGGQFEWTDKFIQEYGPMLEERQRKDALAASRGTGAFYRKSFIEAIRIFTEHRFSSAYQLRARLTVIRARYELLAAGADVYSDLDRDIENFETFLSRNRTFSTTAGDPFRNHLRLLRQLMDRQLRKDYGELSRNRLIAELEGIPGVVARSWLIEKINKRSGEHR